MTVRLLIELLKQAPPDALVVSPDSGQLFEVNAYEDRKVHVLHGRPYRCDGPAFGCMHCGVGHTPVAAIYL